MLLAELLDHLNDMVLDCRAVTALLERNLPRGVVGVVDGVMDGDGDLKGVLSLDGLTSDTHPHGLDVGKVFRSRLEDEQKRIYSPSNLGERWVSRRRRWRASSWQHRRALTGTRPSA